MLQKFLQKHYIDKMFSLCMQQNKNVIMDRNVYHIVLIIWPLFRRETSICDIFPAFNFNSSKEFPRLI